MNYFRNILLLVKRLIKQHTDYRFKLSLIDHDNHRVTVFDNEERREYTMEIDKLYFNHGIICELIPIEAFTVGNLYHAWKDM